MSAPICNSRRRFLGLLGGATVASLLPKTANANIIKAPHHSFKMLNLHTGESMVTEFFNDGSFHPDSMKALNYLLRDHHNGKVSQMDPRLIALLNQLHQTMGAEQPFHIISAYRSPETNQKLQQRSNKVAKRSLHMKGQAIDIRMPGVELKHLHKAALSLKGGGVGLYTRSNFVHLDVGRVRFWGR